jgi:serine/threonine protein kinase
MKIRIASADVMKFFTQMLDGVEAAHLQKVTHRDLKPENFLQNHGLSLSVADFGIAQFTAHELISLVETDPRQRLANFVYAAPEQRSAGRPVTLAADIYSMGLLLNEMFTGTVPHGVDYQTIGAVSPQYSYLDSVVAQMLKQNPDERPATLAHVKALLEKYGTQFIAQQKLDALNSTVIKATDIDNPLASEPPILIDAQWNDGVLRLKLDRDVDKDWIDALNNMGGHSYDIYAPVRSFQFSGPNASVQVPPESAQSVIDHFKRWLPIATAALRNRLNQQIRDQLQKRQQRLEAERKAEELRIQVNSRLRV